MTMRSASGVRELGRSLGQGKHGLIVLLVASILLFSSLALFVRNYASAESSVATISLGGYPYDIDVNPDTNRVYVTTYNRVESNTSNVFVIDGSTNAVVATIWLGEGGVLGVAVNPNTNKIYVVSNHRDISVIDGSTNTIIKNLERPCGTYPSGMQPSGSIGAIDVAVNPNTNMVYVSCIRATRTISPILGYYQSVGYLAVIDGSTDSVKGNITLGPNTWPEPIGVNPNTNRIYVGDIGTSYTYVIDGNTNLLMGIMNTGCRCQGVGVNPNTNRVYFSNFGSNNVTIVDGTTNTAIGSVTVGSETRSVGVYAAANKIYVANSASQTISVIDDNS